MSEPERAARWTATAAAIGLLLWHADTHGYPFCGSVRYVFRTHTPAGRLALTSALGTAALVLHRHLMKVVA